MQITVAGMSTDSEKHSSMKCDMCDVVFNNKSKLIRHMLTHIDEKPFKCSECGTGFTQNSNLKKHRMTHTMVR